MRVFSDVFHGELARGVLSPLLALCYYWAGEMMFIEDTRVLIDSDRQRLQDIGRHL